MRDFRAQPFPKLRLQFGCVRSSRGKLTRRNLRCHTGAHNSRHIFRPRPPPAFLNAAVEDARQPSAAVSIEHPNSLWAIKPVRRQRKQTDPEFLDIDGKPAATRYRVHENRDAALSCNFGHLANRFNCADVMVCMMEAD